MDQLSFYKNSHKRSTNGMSLSNDSIPVVAATAAPQARDPSSEGSFANGASSSEEVSMVGAASLGTAVPVAVRRETDFTSVFKRAARHAACVGHILCSSVAGIDRSVRRAKQLAEAKCARKPSDPITTCGTELFLKTANKDVRRQVFIAMYGEDGVDPEGYNPNGFKPANLYYKSGWKIWIHRNGTRFDDEGYNYYGFHKGGDVGIHRNGTERNPEGRDCLGFDPRGFGINKIHRDTRTDRDPQGYDIYGWNEKRIHYLTGTNRDPEGYDMFGFGEDGFNRMNYDSEGRDRAGYDRRGFNRANMHRNGTRFDEEGYSAMRVHMDEYDADGRDPKGRDYEGIDRRGFRWDKYGVVIEHVLTRTLLDARGFGLDGWNSVGIHVDTGNEYAPDGFNRRGVDEEGYNRKGYNARGYNRLGRNMYGRTREEQFKWEMDEE